MGYNLWKQKNDKKQWESESNALDLRAKNFEKGKKEGKYPIDRLSHIIIFDLLHGNTIVISLKWL